MPEYSFRDGKAPFRVPSRDARCETYYKIYGDLHSVVPPVIILHGGPGSGHEYVEPFKKLWSFYKIPVVLYDQIGCASSTHLPDTAGDKSFWQPSLFVAELENLIEHLHIDHTVGFHVLGHSWGGTLAVAFAARQPPGLRKLILANANASPQLLRDNIWTLMKQLPVKHQEAVEDAVRKDDFTLPEYADAMNAFLKTFLCRAQPFPPPELASDFRNQARDNTVRRTMQGRSPFVYDGSMKDWSNIPLLPRINVPTLVYNGEFDTAQDRSVEPFFNLIPRVRWITIQGASHMPHLDSEEMQGKVLRLVGHFLRQGTELNE